MSLVNGSTVISSWVAGVGNGYVRWLKSPDFNAQDGSYAVALGSYRTAAYSFMEQAVPTTVGQSYEVSAYFATEGNGGPTVVSVLVNGSVIGSVANGLGLGSSGPAYTNLLWTQAALRFRATASTSTIRFQDATTGSDYAPIIDNISVILKPIPPVNLALRVSNGRATVNLTGQSGFRYRLESATTLAAPIWSPVADVTFTSATNSVLDPATSLGAIRFYRVTPLDP